MFKNLWYDSRRSEIHLWEQLNNKDLYTEIPWTPYIYLPSIREEKDATTIFGKPAVKKTFKTHESYKEYINRHKSPDMSENEVRSEIQFLAERYHGIPDDEMYVPALCVYYLDIEVVPEKGFPDWRDPKEPVVLVTVRNCLTGHSVTFGYDSFELRKYTGNYKNLTYIHCECEEDLMRRLFAFFHKRPCDVLSGWNISGFDIPYLINRAKVLWGEREGMKMVRNLSSINRVNVWTNKKDGSMNVDIAGMTILDYFDVYKWYGKKLERYTLEFVSQTVLKVGKLENPYGSHRELAEKDWNRFVDYNIIDCERVNDLENQLGFIKMIQALSLLCKSPMRNYSAQTQLIEGLMLTYYRRNGLCAPYFKGGEQLPFPAAIVKEPHKGMHEWVVDIDITSSYPSHIIACNMSNETFFGRITRMHEKEIISYVRKREFPPFKITREIDNEWVLVTFEGNKLKQFNSALKRGLFAIAPCGSVFVTNKKGVVADVEKFVFFKRKDVKGQKAEWNMKSKKCEGKEKEMCLEKKMQAHSLQLALKIMMNAFFGILSVPYSRYFNVHIAEAITSCGRHTILSGERFCNDLLNDPTGDLLSIFGSEEGTVQENRIDYVKYIDTDSLFVGLGEWIHDQGFGDEWKPISDGDKVEWIKKISACMEGYIDNRIFNETQLLDYNSQVHDFKIAFKQEIIAKTSLFVKKKKYAYWLLNDEGVDTDEIRVTGLEIVRSDSSEAIRPRLKEMMEMIMRQKPDDDIGIKLRQYKKELNKLDPMALAANIGINNINKYLSGGIPKKSTPWHVKGVWGYRHLLKHLGIEDKYEDIQEGLKAKVVYVKKNPWNVDTITFYEWPTEFDNILDFNREIMVEKFFVKKVRFLLDPLNKEHIIDCNMNAVGAFF